MKRASTGDNNRIRPAYLGQLVPISAFTDWPIFAPWHERIFYLICADTMKKKKIGGQYYHAGLQVFDPETVKI